MSDHVDKVGVNRLEDKLEQTNIGPERDKVLNGNDMEGIEDDVVVKIEKMEGVEEEGDIKKIGTEFGCKDEPPENLGQEEGFKEFADREDVSKELSNTQDAHKKLDLKDPGTENSEQEEGELVESDRMDDSTCIDTTYKQSDREDTELGEQAAIKLEEPADIKLEERADIKLEERVDIKLEERVDIQMGEDKRDRTDTIDSDCKEMVTKEPTQENVGLNTKQKSPAVVEDMEQQSKNKRRIPLFDQPIEVEGSRKRNPSEKFQVAHAIRKGSHDSIIIPSGKGVRLGTIPGIKSNIKEAIAENVRNVKELHRIICGRVGTVQEQKKNICLFNGFNFEKNSPQYIKKLSRLDGLSLAQIRSILALLNLNNNGRKDGLRGRLMDFLLVPLEKDTRVRTPARPKRTMRTRKSYTESDEDSDSTPPAKRRRSTRGVRKVRKTRSSTRLSAQTKTDVDTQEKHMDEGAGTSSMNTSRENDSKMPAKKWSCIGKLMDSKMSAKKWSCIRKLVTDESNGNVFESTMESECDKETSVEEKVEITKEEVSKVTDTSSVSGGKKSDDDAEEGADGDIDEDDNDGNDEDSDAEDVSRAEFVAAVGGLTEKRGVNGLAVQAAPIAQAVPVMQAANVPQAARSATVLLASPAIKVVPVSPAKNVAPAPSTVQATPATLDTQAEPAIPILQAVPISPSAQDAPATPTTQDAPATPTTQDAPATPTRQGAPATPNTQDMPDTPSTQGVPATPTAQLMPDTPTTPTTPYMRDTPYMPDTPTTHYLPAIPTHYLPVTPTIQDEPATPTKDKPPTPTTQIEPDTPTKDEPAMQAVDGVGSNSEPEDAGIPKDKEHTSD